MTNAKKLLLLFLFFEAISLKAQLTIFPLDSTYLYKDGGELGATFKKKKRLRTSDNLGGGLMLSYIEFIGVNCSVNYEGKFKIDRENLYARNLDPYIIAIKNEGKIVDTLFLHIPRPIHIALEDSFKSLKIGEHYPLHFIITFDNQQKVSTKKYPNLLHLIGYDSLPEGVKIEDALLTFNGKKVIRDIYLNFFIRYHSELNTVLSSKINYSQIIKLQDNGPNGVDGRSGSYGSNGCAKTPNGGNGDNGSSASHGGNASDMEIHLASIDSIITRLIVKSDFYQNDTFFLEFESGSEVDIQLIGGKGGNGGSGGSGGSGNDSSIPNEIGHGGNGGNGGNAGNGGNGGNLTIYTDAKSQKYISKIHLNNEGGPAGRGGSGGNYGSKGDNKSKDSSSSHSNSKYGDSGDSGYNGFSGKKGGSLKIIKE